MHATSFFHGMKWFDSFWKALNIKKALIDLFCTFIQNNLLSKIIFFWQNRKIFNKNKHQINTHSRMVEWTRALHPGSGGMQFESRHSHILFLISASSLDWSFLDFEPLWKAYSERATTSRVCRASSRTIAIQSILLVCSVCFGMCTYWPQTYQRGLEHNRYVHQPVLLWT